MKRLLYCAAALATLLFAGSCQKENLESVENAQTVSYTIQLPDVINTKAQLGDDVSNVTNLYYEVWRTTDKNTTVFDPQDNHDNRLYHKKVENAFNGGTETIEFQLINDQNFTVLFWADVPGNGIYNAEDLTNVTVLLNSSANQNKYVAFSGVDFIESTTTHLTGRTVQLKRAVAQLNIGTTPKSLKQFEDQITLEKSKVTVKGLSTSFNVATNEAGTISPIVFEYASSAVPVVNPADSLQVDGVNYAYVAMNYVGFAKAAGSTIDVTYEFTTSEGKIDNVIPNVPVKANFRTNIVGNLISSSSSYTVTLDDEWSTNSNSGNIEVINGGIVENQNGDYEITNEEGFAYAVNKLFANGGTFYILNDLNMGSYTLGTVTLTNGKTVNLIGEKPVVTRAASTGSTTGVTITGLKQPLIAEVVEGATASFSNIVVDDYKGAITSAALVGENNGKVVVSGCEATNASNNEVDLVGEGTGEVVDASDNTNGGGLAYLQHMLGTNVTNITLSSPVVIPAGETVELDLKGKTVSHEMNQTGNYQMILNDGTLTIKDSVGGGKISYTDTGDGGEYISNTITNRGTLNVEGGSIENNSSETVAKNGYPYAIDSSIWGEAIEVVTNISGGTVKSVYSPLRVRADSDTEKVEANISGGEIYGRIDHQMSSSKAGVIGILNISGGTFYQYGTTTSSIQVFGAGIDTDASGIKLNITGGDFKAPIIIYRGQYVPLGQNFNEKFISGGTFSFDPTEFLAAGYVANKLGDVWTVSDPASNGISTTAELLAFAQAVNNGYTFSDKEVKLNADIDLNGVEWTSIGTPDNNFCGTFDGDGHTVKNLKVVVTEGKEDKAYIGFFGYAKNATIKNVTFENVNLNIACLDIDHSQGHIGAVAGSLEGTSTIENVTVKGDIKVEATFNANGASRVAVVAGGNSYGNVTMKNVHVNANQGSYLKANNNVGALAGQLQGTSVFENCSSNIDVTGKKFFAGGIIGLAAGNQTFKDCHTTGDITITAGREGRAHDQYRVGGIAGGWADNAKTPCVLTNCSYKGNISGKNSDGAVADPLDYDGYVGRGYTLAGVSGSKVVIDGKDYVNHSNFSTYVFYSAGDVYMVSSSAALKHFADMVNEDNNTFSGKTVKLTTDIDLNNEVWTPIGQTGETMFNGVFDGQDNTIKNLAINSTDKDDDGHYASGLFGWTEGGTIKNLKIENAKVEGGHLCAAVVGYISGSASISNCVVSNAEIICKELDSDDSDPEGDKAACIVGQIGGEGATVDSCNASNSSVSAGRDAGQIVGAALGKIADGVTNCTATNVTVTANNTSSGNNIRNEIIGRI